MELIMELTASRMKLKDGPLQPQEMELNTALTTLVIGIQYALTNFANGIQYGPCKLRRNGTQYGSQPQEMELMALIASRNGIQYDPYNLAEWNSIQPLKPQRNGTQYGPYNLANGITTNYRTLG
ncbi:hypothetical protein HAX54_001876, partial [Datura stramonium]|nr:hypothetical protein [Datura stramonium]